MAEDAVRPVDAGMLEFYNALSEKSPPEIIDAPLDEQRRAWNAVCRAFQAPHPPGLEVRDLDADGVRVRLYRPAGALPLPGIVYSHGGGWVLGSLETHDDMCAEFAAKANVAVVAIDYRLAPEHPHPAQIEDALAVLRWVRREGSRLGIDTGRIVAAGDSAGGQMSAALALMLRDRGEEQLRGQVLIYPVLGADLATASYLRNAHAPCLTREEMAFFLTAFLGPEGSPGWQDPYAVPLLARDLSRLPPAYVTVAAHDPLHDEGVAFHERLLEAGVPSALRREPVLAHSYMRARRASAPAMEGFNAIAAAIRSLAHEGRLPAAA